MGAFGFGSVVGALLLGVPQCREVFAAERSAQCYEYGYDYSGHDIQRVPYVSSPAACMDECATRRGCGFWTYDTFSRACYLKSAEAFIDRKPKQGMVSGPRACAFSPNCFETGVDYYGYDIDRIEGRYVMTAADCQRLCTGNPQCAFFSWKFSSHACFLKSATAILNRREDPDVTSGPRTCSENPNFPPSPSDYPREFDPSGARASCVEAGVEYRGHTVRTVKAKSAPACQRQCQQVGDCFFWTWSSHSQTCAFKDADALGGRTEGPSTLDKVSGAKDCVPVLPGCQFADVGVIGARLTTRTASAFDVCQFYCASFSGCTHFSYDLISGDCTLWSSFNAYSQGRTTQGIVSGPAFCSAEETCFEQSDYVGHNVEENESGEIESPAACQALCRDNAQCHYWTWLRNNKGCYLKDANAVLGKVNDATSLGRFSGPKYCTVTFGCVSINAIYAGLSFLQEDVEDYKACAAACSEDIFCTAWTFHADLGVCSLFSNNATLNSRSVRGALSGARTCMSRIEQDASCFEEGILYNRDSLAGIAEVKSALECYRQCQSKSMCKHWSFKNGETCFLLSGENTLSSVFDPSSVSGPRLCPSETFLSQNGGLDDKAPLATAQVYTAKGCMQKCKQTPNCQNWSLVLGQEENCHLYATLPFAMVNADAVSGSMLPSSFFSTRCTFDDPLTSLIVSKPADCLAECQAHMLCRGWQTKQETLSGASSPSLTCTLFRSADNPATIRDPTATCGTSVMPGTISWGVTNGKWMDEHDSSVEGCSKACLANPKCSLWSYTTLNGCLLLDKGDVESSTDGVVGYPERRGPRLQFDVKYTAPVQNAKIGQRLASRFRRHSAAKQATPRDAANINTCIKECMSQESCSAWSFHDNVCSTFSSPAVQSYEKGAVSGPRSSGILPWAFELGKKCNNEPLLSLPDSAFSAASADPLQQARLPQTAMECAERAKQEGEENSWSFKEATEDAGPICYVYDDCESLLTEEGYITGQYIGLKPEQLTSQ